MSNEDYSNGQHHPIPDTPDCTGNAAIRNQQFSSGHTSNDLWSGLDAMHPSKAINYEVIAQNADEVQDLENAPPFSMGPYLVSSGQMHLMTTANWEPAVIRLYMNASALLVWKAMGRNPTLLGAQNRAPRTALLMSGVPFSD